MVFRQVDWVKAVVERYWVKHGVSQMSSHGVCFSYCGVLQTGTMYRGSYANLVRTWLSMVTVKLNIEIYVNAY